ncbi:MAG: flavodoxin domain-containing protein [Bacteroidales bacterium]
MKTAIIFTSKHGSAEKVANELAQGIGRKMCRIIDLKSETDIDLSAFEQVILGASIYAGTIQKRMKKFCESNMHELMNKRLGLYICAMDEQRYEQELKDAWPEMLRRHALAAYVMGGEFNFQEMNFLERMVVKKVSGVTKSVASWRDEASREMIEKMQNK